MANVVTPPTRSSAAVRKASANSNVNKSSKKPKKPAKKAAKPVAKPAVASRTKKPASAPATSRNVKNKKKRARKMTVRAPIPQEEFEKISIGSDDEEEDKEKLKLTRKRGIATASAVPIIKKEKFVIKPSKNNKSEDEEKEVKAPSPKKKISKKKKEKVGAVKKEEEKPSSSPRKSGRPSRIVQPFMGGQKMAAFAKNFFNSFETPVDGNAQAIVVERSTFDLTKPRRQRSIWTDSEVTALEKGVNKHGEGSWSAILNDSSLKFHQSRTQVDLKDKWRNLNSYVPYNNHPIRRFVLVNSKHEVALSPAGNPRVFNNRWPRDAAMKVATRDEFYVPGEDGHAPEAILIHLKEIMEERARSERPPVVHVYRGTRVLQRSKDIKKFEGYAAIWTAKVEKVAEEILIKSSDVFTDEA